MSALGRTPIGHQQPINPGITEGGNETVPGGKIGNHSPVQRKRGAQESGNAAFGHGEVTQPDRMQLKRNLARRGSFRLLRGAVGAGIESQELRRNGRCSFSGRHGCERRPKERRIGELTSEMPIHLNITMPASSLLN
jgi:hypothetical protein